MTKQEVLSLDHLSIATETKFVHIHTEEGYIMTDWKEGDDIKQYSGSNCYYMPIREVYPDYRVITIEEHNRLEEQREIAVKEAEQAEIEANKEIVNE